jgi:peptide/nickel transport system permease protein
MILGIVLGSLAALSNHRGQADVILFFAIVGVSAPTFLLAVLLQTLGIKYTLTFGQRLVSMGGYAWDFEHLLMPVLVLMARPLAYVTRATYVALGEILGADYIRTAHSKGLRERRVFFGHILRNLGISILTAFGVSFRFTLGVLPIVEFIFAWPGLGQYALDAVQRREAILFIVVVISLSLTIQLLNMMLDWLNHRIDPRLGEA